MVNRKCLQCNNSTTQLTFKFTCEHILCGICISRLLILNNFSPILKFNSPIKLKCHCNKGYYEDSLDKLYRILFETQQRDKKKEVATCPVHSQAASSYCNDCKKWICDVCVSTFHNTHFPKHILLSTEPLDELNCLSNNHNLKKDLFCQTCDDNICSRCIAKGGNHYQHKTIEYETYIRQIKNKTNFKFKAFENFANVIDTIESSFKTSFTHSYNECNKTIDSIVAKLHEIKINYTQKVGEYNKFIDLLFKIIKSSYYNFYFELSTPEPNSISLNFLNKINNEFDDLVADYPFGSNMKIALDSLNKINSKEFVEFNMKFKYHRLTCVKELKDNDSQVYSVYELNDKTIASGYSDHSIKIWDPTKGECILRLIGHAGTVFSLLQLKDQRLISGSGDTNIIIWSIEEQKMLHVLKGHSNDIFSLCELTNGTIASSSKDTTIIIWNLNDLTPRKKLIGNQRSLGYILELKENVLLFTSPDSKIFIWHLDDDVKPMAKLVGHTNTIFSMLALPNEQLASGSCDKTIKIWNLSNLKCIHSFIGHTGFIWSMALLSPDRIISCSSDSTFKIWDLALFNCITTVEAHTQDITSVIILKSNNQIVTSSSDSLIKIWDY